MEEIGVYDCLSHWTDGRAISLASSPLPRLLVGRILSPFSSSPILPLLLPRESWYHFFFPLYVHRLERMDLLPSSAWDCPLYQPAFWRFKRQITNNIKQYGVSIDYRFSPCRSLPVILWFSSQEERGRVEDFPVENHQLTTATAVLTIPKEWHLIQVEDQMPSHHGRSGRP